MASISMTIPKMLADLVGGDRRFEVEADSVRGALEAVIERHPELRVHVFDESGAIRRHVTLFHNESMQIDLDEATAAGDTITILQAVSGG